MTKGIEERPHIQALVIADCFNNAFQPVTQQIPKVCNAPTLIKP